MTLLDFIILTLATWRISSLFVEEDGPFGIFAELRAWAGVRYDEFSNAHGVTALAGLFSCLFCFSVWVGLILAVVYVFFSAQTVLVCLPLALSAGAIVVNKWTQ